MKQQTLYVYSTQIPGKNIVTFINVNTMKIIFGGALAMKHFIFRNEINKQTIKNDIEFIKKHVNCIAVFKVKPKLTITVNPQANT